MLRLDQSRKTARSLAIAIASAIGLGLVTLDASSSDERRPALQVRQASIPQVIPPANVVPSPLRRIGEDDGTSIEVTIDPVLLEQAREAANVTGRVRLGNVEVPGRGSVNLELTPILPFTNDAVLLAVDADGVDARVSF